MPSLASIESSASFGRSINMELQLPLQGSVPSKKKRKPYLADQLHFTWLMSLRLRRRRKIEVLCWLGRGKELHTFREFKSEFRTGSHFPDTPLLPREVRREVRLNETLTSYSYSRGFRGGFDRGFEKIPSLIHENLSSSNWKREKEVVIAPVRKGGIFGSFLLRS